MIEEASKLIGNSDRKRRQRVTGPKKRRKGGKQGQIVIVYAVQESRM